MGVYEALNLAPFAVMVGFLLQPYFEPLTRNWDKTW